MSTIIKMSKALRKATGNVAASDEFLQALEERETQREAQRDARETQREARETQREAREAQREEQAARREKRFDRMHQQAMHAIKQELGLMHRENKFIIAMLGVGFPILGLLVLLTH